MIGQQIAEIAKKYAGVSAHQNTKRYLEVICRPSDNNPKMINYYAGPTPPSTCGLFACGVYRLADILDPILINPYRVGHAVSDIIEIGGHYGGWKTQKTFSGKLNAGDVIIIFGKYGEHVMVCVSNSTIPIDGLAFVDTVEGGQAPDSSGIKAFNRQLLKNKNGIWCIGTSVIIGIVEASCFELKVNAKKQDTIITQPDINLDELKPEPIPTPEPIESTQETINFFSNIVNIIIKFFKLKK